MCFPLTRNTKYSEEIDKSIEDEIDKSTDSHIPICLEFK